MISGLSTVEDCGSIPAGTSVGLDGAAHLLRLSGLAEDLGLIMSPQKDASSQYEPIAA